MHSRVRVCVCVRACVCISVGFTLTWLMIIIDDGFDGTDGDRDVLV